MINDLRFEFPDELFEEDEFNRLVSFSKCLAADTPDFDGSTLGDPTSCQNLPQTFGCYELIRLLEKGRVGTTYLAQDVESSTEFAVTKIYRSLVKRMGSEWITKRLEHLHRDSMAANAIFADYVTPISKVGEIDGEYFFSTRYISGKSLGKVINSNTITNRQAALTAKAIAESIHQLHKVGIFHRDLEPANIMLDSDSIPHILPGITLLQAENEGAEETPNSFQAPEVTNRSGVNAAAEIWSIGAILYNCLVGEPPAKASVIPPRKRNTKVARDLETICLKCLHKQPRRRYSDAAALADDLDLFLEYQPINASPAGLIGNLINKLAKMG